MRIKPLEQKTLNKELLQLKVVRKIISQIATGEYRQAQRLPAERKLCESFGVSRGTLREALMDLERMGVIAIRPGSGSYVKNIRPSNLSRDVLPPRFSKMSLDDALVARKAIELAAIELACKRITRKQLGQLELLVNQMDEAIDDLPEFIKQDMRFHETLVQLGGNAALVTAFEAIWEYHQYSQIFSSSSDEGEEMAQTYHKKIVRALGNKNRSKAIKALRDHFDHML
jgi:GntR family transcriptional repressor for pyruvate dehydrogenase complex